MITSHNVLVIFEQLAHLPDVVFLVPFTLPTVAATTILWACMSSCESVSKEVVVNDILTFDEIFSHLQSGQHHGDLSGGLDLVRNLAKGIYPDDIPTLANSVLVPEPDWNRIPRLLTT